MRNAIYITIGLLGLIVGLAFFLTPIPLGIPLVGLSLMLLVATSRFFAKSLMGIRSDVPRVHRWIAYLEDRSGRRIRRILRKTRPQRVPRVRM